MKKYLPLPKRREGILCIKLHTDIILLIKLYIFAEIVQKGKVWAYLGDSICTGSFSFNLPDQSLYRTM